MTNDSIVLDKFDQILRDLSDAIDEGLDAAVEKQGLLNTCPHCVSKEIFDESRTAIANNLFKAGGTDPRLLLSAITKTLYATSALEYALQECLKEAVELFREELELDDDA